MKWNIKTQNYHILKLHYLSSLYSANYQHYNLVPKIKLVNHLHATLSSAA